MRPAKKARKSTSPVRRPRQDPDSVTCGQIIKVEWKRNKYITACVMKIFKNNSGVKKWWRLYFPSDGTRFWCDLNIMNWFVPIKNVRTTQKAHGKPMKRLLVGLSSELAKSVRRSVKRMRQKQLDQFQKRMERMVQIPSEQRARFVQNEMAEMNQAVLPPCQEEPQLKPPQLMQVQVSEVQQPRMPVFEKVEKDWSEAHEGTKHWKQDTRLESLTNQWNKAKVAALRNELSEIPSCYYQQEVLADPLKMSKQELVELRIKCYKYEAIKSWWFARERVMSQTRPVSPE